MRWNLEKQALRSCFLLPHLALIVFIYPSTAAVPILPETVKGLDLKDKIAQLLAQNVPVPPVINPQPDPNRDRFLQPKPIPVPIPSENQPPLQQQQPPESEPQLPTTPIQVQSIEVKGSTILSPEEIKSITKFEGTSITVQELRKITSIITQIYLDRGYINSRAILPNQPIANGIVQIQVIEGTIDRIEVEGSRRLKPTYIRDRIALGVGKPLNSNKLEEQLRLLRIDPLFKDVQANLRPSGLGKSILIVRVQEANSLEAGISFDNYSPPSVGSERYGVNLRYRNLTGLGDEIAASYNGTTTRGIDVLDFTYRVPLNPMNGTLQVRAAPNQNVVTQSPFDTFDIAGESQLYEVSYRQPIIRSIQKEFALSLGFGYQVSQTFLGGKGFPFSEGANNKGISRTSVFKFGQDYTSRDNSGIWSLRSQFNFGVDFFDATINSGSTPDGRFFSWLGQVQRVENFNADNLLILSSDIQLTPDTLLPSQQFIIGGGQSLRGYRQNARIGDNGLRFSVEDRITLLRNSPGASSLQIAPFADLGIVWNAANNPNPIGGQKFLAGAGLGILWSPVNNLNLRLDYGVPLIDTKIQNRNLQDSGFYFSLNYQLF